MRETESVDRSTALSVANALLTVFAKPTSTLPRRIKFLAKNSSKSRYSRIKRSLVAIPKVNSSSLNKKVKQL